MIETWLTLHSSTISTLNAAACRVSDEVVTARPHRQAELLVEIKSRAAGTRRIPVSPYEFIDADHHFLGPQPHAGAATACPTNAAVAVEGCIPAVRRIAGLAKQLTFVQSSQLPHHHREQWRRRILLARENSNVSAPRASNRMDNA